MVKISQKTITFKLLLKKRKIYIIWTDSKYMYIKLGKVEYKRILRNQSISQKTTNFKLTRFLKKNNS